jgi:hypothetical protein
LQRCSHETQRGEGRADAHGGGGADEIVQHVCASKTTISVTASAPSLSWQNLISTFSFTKRKERRGDGVSRAVSFSFVCFVLFRFESVCVVRTAVNVDVRCAWVHVRNACCRFVNAQLPPQIIRG